VKSRKIIPLLLIVAVLVSLFAACQGAGTTASPSPSASAAPSASASAAPSGAAVNLGDSVTIWMKKMQVDSMNTNFQAKCDEIAKQYGTNVVSEIIAYEDFPQKWAAGIESGEVPDLSFMTYAEVGLYYQDNLLTDVTSTVKDIQSKNDTFYANLMDPITFEGKTYMIPMWTESQILYYRTDLIPTPPKTWEEFRTIAKQVSDPVVA
jgi:multiple sugar transport system substrate-binding protein